MIAEKVNVAKTSRGPVLFQTKTVAINAHWLCRKGQCKIGQPAKYQILGLCDVICCLRNIQLGVINREDKSNIAMFM